MGARTGKVVDAMLPRKTSKVRSISVRTKTDTGRRGENPKTREITLVKELGKIPPNLR